MFPRLVYAVGKTVKNLDAVLKTKSDYEILLAFVVTLIGFGAMHFAIVHDVNNIFAPVLTGCAVATVFFLSTIGFITFISIIYVFAYNFTVGPERGFNPSSLSRRSRGWRIVLSFVVSGAVTAAAFNLFYEGLKEIPFVGTQYPFLLHDGD
jgi:uncharacterized BrkB/YihY/UPF0761 family membrane protein